MATSIRNQSVPARAGSGSAITHTFQFGTSTVGAVAAATLRQAGDGVVKSVARAAAGRYTITLTPPSCYAILDCRVSYTKVAQTDAEVFGHLKEASLTAGSPGVNQTFEIFFATSAGAAADVPNGATVTVVFTEVTNKFMFNKVDN